MAKRKESTTEQELRKERQNIQQEIARWEHINKHGCNDPFWPDGCNMNLTRSHILYAKEQIRELCKETGAGLPDEYFLPTPPIVDENYMANTKQKARVERLIQQGDKLTKRKNKYDATQMSLF